MSKFYKPLQESNSDEKDGFQEILNHKYPTRKILDYTDNGHRLILNKVYQGYTFSNLLSNKKLEDKGVNHYLVAKNHLNQIKYLYKDYSRGISKATWNVYDGYSGVLSEPEEKNDSLLETLLKLQSKEFRIVNISSFFEDIEVEDPDLLVGVMGIQQRPIIQVIPVKHPLHDDKTIWLNTTKK